MKWSPETRARIVQALKEKIPNQRLPVCVVCQKQSWDLLEAFPAIESSTEITGYPFSDPLRRTTIASQDIVFVYAALTCNNCGNTLFLNVRMLGLDDLLMAPDWQNTQPDPALLPPGTPHTE